MAKKIKRIECNVCGRRVMKGEAHVHVQWSHGATNCITKLAKPDLHWDVWFDLFVNSAIARRDMFACGMFRSEVEDATRGMLGAQREPWFTYHTDDEELSFEHC